MPKKIEITAQFTVYENQNELTPPDQLLVSAALAARAGSHSPYSEFQVGAAVQLADGQIITGANIENAAYGPTTCAEQVALFSVMKLGQETTKQVRTIAVVGPDQKPTLITPCGVCRQVIKEVEDIVSQPLRILMVKVNGEIYETVGIENLLPLGFGPADLQ